MACRKYRQGPPGDSTLTGPTGADGVDGIDGVNGADGRDGVDGRDGRDGTNGRDGRDGTNGTQGLQGIPGPGSAITFTNSTTRGTTIPTVIGQLGIQLSDRSLWESTALTPGAWIPVPVNLRYTPDAAGRAAMAPRFLYEPLIQVDSGVLYYGTGLSAGNWTVISSATAATPNYPSSLRLAFVGDTGEQGARQTALADALTDANVQYTIFCGDNSYGGESEFDDDWSAFDIWIDNEIAIPVLGNHDIDGASLYGLHTAKFPYLPNNQRYYNLILGSGLLEIFVLNDGVNSAYEDPISSGGEPDGNEVGSTQHTWFVAALNASTARWKIVCFHHPLVSNEQGANIIVPEMDWPEFSRVHGLFHGHTHMSEWLTLRGIPVINASGAVRLVTTDANSGTKTDGDAGLAPLNTVSPTNSRLVWTNDRDMLFARLNVTPTTFVVEYVSVSTGNILYQRQLQDITNSPDSWGQEVLGPDDPVYVGMFFIGITPVGMLVNHWFISVAQTGGDDLTGRIFVDGLQVASFTIPTGEYWARIEAPALNYRLRLGAFVQVEILTNADYPSWQGLQASAEGTVVQ